MTNGKTLKEALNPIPSPRPELSEGNALLSAILESATDYAIVSTDLEGRITSWNSGACNVLGWTEAEALGQPLHIIFTPEDRALGSPIAEMRIALKEGRATDERWHLHKNGSRFWGQGQVMPLKGSDDTIIGFLKILRNRTEQRLATDAVHESSEALRASEERFRAAIQAVDGVLWTNNAQGEMTGEQPGWAGLTGQSYAEYQGYGWAKAIHSDDVQPTIDAWQAAVTEKRLFTFEHRVRRHDGEWRLFSVRAIPAFNADGSIREWVGVHTDVTEWRVAQDALKQEIAHRKRAEQRVQHRSARLELLAEAIEKAPSAHSLEELMEIIGSAARRLSKADGVAVVLREGEQCFYAAENSALPLWKGQRFPFLSCISGHSMQNLRTEVVTDVRADPRLPQEIYDATFVRSLVMVPLVSDGEATAAIGAYWSEVRTPSPNEVATLEALARTAGAVLRKLQAEQALRALNETLEAQVAERTADRDRMWRLSTDVMLVARLDGTITATNPAWKSLFGWRKGELIGNTFLNLVHPDDVESTLAEVSKLSQGVTTFRFENRYRHKDGSYRWLSWIAVPEGDFIHAVGRDITAEKEAAEALRQTEEALRQAQKMEAVGQLTGGIAHDFNNLLTGIIGSLDMMQTRISQGRTDMIERYAKAATTSAHRAAALTHRLLAFARRQPLDPKPVDANRLVHSMEDLLRRTMGEAIDMKVAAAGDLWRTLCDPHQLESAILNLAINARDAMPDGGKLTIETSNTQLDEAYAARHQALKAGQYICIAVTDSGTGMTSDVIARAFDPFFTTKPFGQGTGLGLSMIYGFTQQSEGHARIYSEVGQGTTVKIYLPRFHGDTEEEYMHTGPAQEHRAGAGETVLVVEDEPVVRSLIVDVLKDLGYTALEAADGPSGLKILQSQQRIDLLVSDVGLPGLNGRQLADQARGSRPDLRILFITGYAENAAVAHGFLAAGMEMITKPFAVEVLASRIRQMIET